MIAGFSLRLPVWLFRTNGNTFLYLTWSYNRSRELVLLKHNLTLKCCFLTIALVINLHTIKNAEHCRIIFVSFCIHTVELVGSFGTAFSRVADHEKRQALTWYDLTVLNLVMHHPPVPVRCILLPSHTSALPFYSVL